jgi:phage shock protein A
MSMFKRLSTTLVSRIDNVVGEIENHDAVIQASLSEMRKKIAQAKVNLTQIHREEAKLKQQIEELNIKQQKWRERAISCAAADEAKALTCLQKRQHCQQETARLKQALETYQQTSQKLAQDISDSETQLAEKNQKQTLMRARQSSSAALNASNKSLDEDACQLDNSFDRWEVKISQTEMCHDTTPMIDPIEHDFITQEQQHELRQELTQLLAEEKNHEH